MKKIENAKELEEDLLVELHNAIHHEQGFIIIATKQQEKTRLRIVASFTEPYAELVGNLTTFIANESVPDDEDERRLN